MKVVLVQSALPEYRSAFLTELVRRTPGSVDIMVGSALFERSVRTTASMPVATTSVHNIFLGGRRLMWQRGVFVPGLRADVSILELNPRILSVWATIVGRRLLRRPTILWGHAWPRRGRAARTDRLRSLLRRQADVLVVYTESQAKDLRAELPRKPILAAPNALYRGEDMKPVPVRQPLSFLFSGRLVPEKKPALLVEAFARALGKLGDTRLIVIGNGPERGKLLRAAQRLGVADRLDTPGSVTDPSRLRDYYAQAIASVSPGYVGLSIIQSLGFGVPMIVASEEPHSPEIEAAVTDLTARFFETDSVASLADALVALYESRSEWLARRAELSDWCRARYSAEQMAARFGEAIARAAGSRAPKAASGSAPSTSHPGRDDVGA